MVYLVIRVGWNFVEIKLGFKILTNSCLDVISLDRLVITFRLRLVIDVIRVVLLARLPDNSNLTALLAYSKVALV
jgi:hypothetical protein